MRPYPLAPLLCGIAALLTHFVKLSAKNGGRELWCGAKTRRRVDVEGGKNGGNTRENHFFQGRKKATPKNRKISDLNDFEVEGVAEPLMERIVSEKSPPITGEAGPPSSCKRNVFPFYGPVGHEHQPE